MSEEEEEQAPPVARKSIVVYDTIICVSALAVFLVLSAKQPNQTALLGTVLGAFTTVLLVQLHLRNDVREGQKRAAKRSAEVMKAVDPHNAMPRTLEELRGVIRDLMRAEMPGLARSVIEELQTKGMLPPDRT